MFEERVDGSLDEIRNVVNDQKLHARRQLRPQFIELAFYAVSNLDCVGAGLAQHLNTDDILARHAFAKETRPCAQLLRAVLHLRHIAHTNLRAAACANDDFAELFGGGDASESTQSEFLRTGNHSPARRFDIFALQSVAHVKHSEIVSGQFLRIEQNAYLTRLSAVELNAADAIHCLDRPTDLLVRDLGQFAATDWTAYEQGQNRVGLRVLLGDDGRERVARQAIHCGGYFFPDILRRAVDVAFQNERASNVRKTFAGVDGDFVDATYRRDSVLKWQHHPSNDLFGRSSRQLNIDVNCGRIGFRKKIDGQTTVRKRAQRHEKSDQHHGKDGILYAGFG